METTRVNRDYNRAAALYMAIDTGAGKWVLLFSSGDQRQREVTVGAGDRPGVEAQITAAKDRFELPANAPVFSCYEAGRDGFWIHRWLQSIGVNNRVVHPASIEVPQRAKRVKTDRVDVRKLLTMLLHVCAGEKHVWKELKVPTPEHEDHRRPHRERERLLKERNSLGNRIGSLLATQGVRLKLAADFQQQLQAAHCWDGQPLPPQLVAEIERMWIRRQMACEQLRALERKRCQDLVDPQNASAAPMRQLMWLCGVGLNTAWILCSEFFAWREIANRRQLAALAGMAPTPFNSGNSEREQGIGKDGNRRVRATMVEIAWTWLRWQPHSELAQWFHRRFGAGSKRSKRIGIVALARRLLVALWRYHHDGVVPAGATFKGAA